MSKTPSTKDRRIDLRVTQSQKELLEKAAALQGVSLSTYTLLRLLPTAQQEIDDREKIVLTDRDRDLLMAALENPPELSIKLKSTIDSYRAKYDK